MLRFVKSKRCRAISRVVHLGGVTIAPFVATEIPGNSTRNDEEPGQQVGEARLRRSVSNGRLAVFMAIFQGDRGFFLRLRVVRHVFPARMIGLAVRANH